jgi:hypothetical protein
VPDIVADPAKPAEWLPPDLKQPHAFPTVGQASPPTLVPLYRVIHERYLVYWKVGGKSA